mmetsp:Transcript_28308/g.65646  ORF Transcript_28308/g.65646 Transcript_28308/m.65646 type:complete len:204 (+) Transcript_28308:25-636(+)
MFLRSLASIGRLHWSQSRRCCLEVSVREHSTLQLSRQVGNVGVRTTVGHPSPWMHTAAPRSLLSPGLCDQPRMVVAAQLVLTRGKQRLANKINWPRVREKVKQYQDRNKKDKMRNHSETLARFRLTRFGWERRRARFNGKRKRRRSRAAKMQSKKITFVHRSDWKKVSSRLLPLSRLYTRDWPRDMNLNLHPHVREILPAHLG